MTMRIVTKSELWRYPAETAAWHFVTLDPSARKKADAVRGKEKRRGWGQIAVTATVGATSWKTSIFPDKQQGWLLPVKAEVRRKEGLVEGDIVRIALEVR